MKQQNFNIIAIFKSETEDSSSLFFPAYTEDLNINISSLKEFCVASGGLREFDYWSQ